MTTPAHTQDEFLTQFAATYRFSHGRPKSITVTPGGDAVLFLRSGPRSFVQDLYCFDTATGKERVLLTADQVLGGGEEKLTAEELARRERMRMSSRGIASYQLTQDGAKILVPLSGRLFVIDRATGAKQELRSEAGFPIDPRFSSDGSLLACVRNGEVYATDIAAGREWRVTSGAGGTVSNGLAEFVAQEEMSRFHGFWFSPDARTILYQQTDTAGMEMFHIADPVNPNKEAESWPYPRAGQQNAAVKLGFVPVNGGATTWVQWDSVKYPYVATVTWAKNAPPTILVQNRNQTEQLLLAVDEKTGATTTLLREADDAWIDIHESCPKWLEDGSGFLWVTDCYGGSAGKDYLRLELRNRDGSFRKTITPEGFPLYDLDSFDKRTGNVYLRACADPTRQQVWRMPISGEPRDPVLILDGDGEFDATFGESHTVYVESASTRAGGLYWKVRTSEERVLGEIGSVAEKPPFVPGVEITSVGENPRFYAAVVKPRGFVAGRKYPVIVQVYGGPGTTTVHATGMGFLLQQWLADHGFIVVSIDNRGTPRRGRAWERVTKNNLIDIPLKDQCDALKMLGEKFPEMDMSRVGITGWSFGGYFSAMAAMRRPDVFKCGVAGAPVCAWEDYDTHYTERYMSLPGQNPEGYKASNVLTYCKDLTVPLLIIHGTADDNVYFMHSLKMTGELFRNGREFEFLPLAGFTHMVPDPVVMQRLQGRVADFFCEKLRP